MNLRRLSMIMSTSKWIAHLSKSFELAMRSLASGARKLACACQGLQESGVGAQQETPPHKRKAKEHLLRCDPACVRLRLANAKSFRSKVADLITHRRIANRIVIVRLRITER